MYDFDAEINPIKADAPSPTATADARLTASERSIQARQAAHTRWAKTDRRDASEAARRRQIDRFEREVDPDGTLHPAERARRGEHARKAYMAGLALKSAKIRRLNRNG